MTTSNETVQMTVATQALFLKKMVKIAFIKICLKHSQSLENENMENRKNGLHKTVRETQ